MSELIPGLITKDTGSDYRTDYNIQKMNGTTLTEKDRKKVLRKCPAGTIDGNVLTFWTNGRIQEDQTLENIGQGGYRLTDIN